MVEKTQEPRGRLRFYRRMRTTAEGACAREETAKDRTAESFFSRVAVDCPEAPDVPADTGAPETAKVAGPGF